MPIFRTVDEHTMLDIETLGTQTNSFILSIGVVKFSKDYIFPDSLHVHVNDAGGCIDLQTVLWWLRQEEEARTKQVSAQRVSMRDGLRQVVDFVGDRPVWGNGSSFDLTIFRAACERHGVQCWNQWQDRCYRTWKQGKEAPGEFLPKHDALNDAMNQAHHMIQQGGF